WNGGRLGCGGGGACGGGRGATGRSGPGGGLAVGRRSRCSAGSGGYGGRSLGFDAFRGVLRPCEGRARLITWPLRRSEGRRGAVRRVRGGGASGSWAR